MAIAAATADTHYVGAGDDIPYVEAILRDPQGTPLPLTDEDVLFKMRKWPTAEPSIGGAAVIVTPGAPSGDAARGRVRYMWQDGQTLQGTWECQWKVTFADGKVAHFPNYGYDVVRISAIIPDPLP